MSLRVGFDAALLVLNRAGESRYASGLLEALRRDPDLELDPLIPTRRRPGDLRQRVALQAGVQGLWYPLALPRRVRRARTDLVHFPRPLVPPTPGLRVPTVLTIHDVLVLRAPQLFSAVIRANFRLLAPAAARRATRIVTGSEFSRRDTIELLDVPAERVVVTPWGIDPRFRPVAVDPEVLRRRFGIDRPYVLCVGTLEPRKNLVTAVRAFARLGDLGGEVALVLAGGQGWDGGALERELASVSAPVVRTGYVDDEDLVTLLSGARCFLYPSLFEGFGFPPLEAMACGAPVITSRRASLPEVVGDAALLVDPEDVEDVTEALRRLLGSPELSDELRRRGTARAGFYTWRRCAALTAEVYRQAVASARC